MNNENNPNGQDEFRPSSASTRSNKGRLNRVKSAHFDEDVAPPVYIPPSKTVKYDPFVEERRKDVVEEFRSRRFTYVGIVIIGLVLVILGAIFIWVGLHFTLRDFYIIGPASLIIGIAMDAAGLFFLLRGIHRTKNANLSINNQSNLPPSRSTTPGLHSDNSFITTSEVTIHGISGKATPSGKDLYGSDFGSLDRISLVNSIYEPSSNKNGPRNKSASRSITNGGKQSGLSNPSSDALYSTSLTSKSPELAVLNDNDNNSIPIRHSSPVNNNPDEITDKTGQVYHIYPPNRPITTEEDVGNDDNMYSIPEPAYYIEPNLNEDNVVTAC